MPHSSKPPFKKFILFAWDNYYPSGGMGDVVGSFDTVDEAREFLDDKDHANYDCAYVVDRDTWQESANLR